MKTSKEIFDAIGALKQEALDSLVSAMLQSGKCEFDLTVDRSGRAVTDEDYNEDEAYDDRVWVECFSKRGVEDGYATKLCVDGKSVKITAVGDETGWEYDDYSIQVDVFLYASLLGWLEEHCNNKQQKQPKMETKIIQRYHIGYCGEVYDAIDVQDREGNVQAIASTRLYDAIFPYGVSAGARSRVGQHLDDSLFGYIPQSDISGSDEEIVASLQEEWGEEGIF